MNTRRGFWYRLCHPSMMVLLFVGLGLFIAWAAVFELEQGVRAQGQIIATSRTQVIQAADGGVLLKMLVSEGQQVQAGQLLAVLEKGRAESGFEEIRAKASSLRTALMRTNAEVRLGRPIFAKGADREFVLPQMRLYEQRKRSLDEELASLNEALTMAREELQMNDALLASGDVSRLDMLRARRQVTDLEGKIAAVRNKYLQDASAEAAKLEEDLASVNSKLSEKQSILDHTDLNAPVAGVVKLLRVTTIGGVLRPGDELMQIAPTENELIIEAKVLPADIGLLRTGLPVSVKLDAFDYSVYGSLNGEVIYISPDTLSEPAANNQTSTFYRVQVRLNKHVQNARGKEIIIKPGMTASLDIRIGSRTVLQYIAKPVVKAFGGALSEH